MIYTSILTLHLLCVFIYGGFLFVDIFFLSRMKESLNKDEHKIAREAVMQHVRKVVPWALLLAVATGLYLISQVFGSIENQSLSYYQSLLALKAFLGIWLGIRGFNQKFFKINPFVFKGHALPFTFVLSMIFLSKFMYL